MFQKKSETTQKQNEAQYINKTDYLFKELPLFKFEWLILGGSLMASLFLMLLSRAQVLGDITYSLIILGPGLALAIYVFKFLNFMPRGDKHIIVKFYKTGSAYFSVQKINSNDKINMRLKNENLDVALDRPNKHFEPCSGKNLILAVEGQSHNCGMFDKENNATAESVNRALTSQFYKGIQFKENQMLQHTKSFFSDPTKMLLIIMLGLLAVLLFFNWGMMNNITALIGKMVEAQLITPLR